jgi:hypothetical protein
MRYSMHCQMKLDESQQPTPSRLCQLSTHAQTPVLCKARWCSWLVAAGSTASSSLHQATWQCAGHRSRDKLRLAAGPLDACTMLSLHPQLHQLPLSTMLPSAVHPGPAVHHHMPPLHALPHH